MAAEERFSVSVSFRGDGQDNSHVSFSTYRKTQIQQIVDSAMAFFKITPSMAQPQLVCSSGKQVLQWGPGSTVDDLKLTVPERQSLELVLQDDEPEVSFPIKDQYGNEDVLQARLYHPFLDAVRRLVEPGEAQAQGQGQQGQQPVPEIDLYRASDVSPISLQNSPAACGLQGGEQLLVYKFGRASREYWQQRGHPEPAKPITFSGLYISDYKNQFQGRPVFRHDLSMPLEPLLATYCKWRGIELGRASFLWLQFYMRLGLHDTGVARGMDDGDTIYVYDKQDHQGALWDAVLDGNPEAVQVALDAGAVLNGPEGSFEAITCRWPLHAAAANNHIEVAKLLVARGADLDKLDAVSEPALWHAVEQGHGRMVEALLEVGATASDLPAPQGAPKADYAALCHAAEKGSLPMVQLLLVKGANPYTYDDTGYCAYDYLVDQAKPLELLRALLDADKAFGATQKQYQQAYQRLCAAVKRAQRYPALGCNCRTCNSVVEVRATEAEAAQTLKAQIGCVALVRAVQAGGGHCLDAMKLLHERGALLDGQDQDGRTALHQAIRYNRLPEARWLVSAGAHLDVPDFEGLLPLHQAACTGNVEFARLLVEAGAPINLHTVKYITQESLEAQTKKQDTGTGGRKAAKKRNALDVTGLTTIGGNSALALAVRHGHAAVVDYLLQQGAQFDLKNPADSSAFHAALDRGAATVASKLLSHLNKPKTGKGMAPAAPPAVATASSTNGVLSTVTRPRAKSDAKASSAGARKAVAHVSHSSDSDSQEASPSMHHKAGGDAGGSEGGCSGGSSGEAAQVEPALAVDAGAGLKEMVARERERLRQQLGLGRSHTSDAAAATAAATASRTPSLMEQLAASKAAAAAAAAKAQVDAEMRAKAAAAAAKARAEAEAKAKAEAETKAKAEAEAMARAEADARAKAEADAKAAKARADAAAKARAEAEAKAKADAAAQVEAAGKLAAAKAAAAPQETATVPADAAASSANSSSSVSQNSSPTSATPPRSHKAQQQQQQQQPARSARQASVGAASAKANGPVHATNSAPDGCSDVSKQRDIDADSKPAAKPPGVQILFRSTTAAAPAKQASPAPSSASSRRQAAAQAREAAALAHAAAAAHHAHANASGHAAAGPAASQQHGSKRGKKAKHVLTLDELTIVDEHRAGGHAHGARGNAHGAHGKSWSSFVNEPSSNSNLAGVAGAAAADGELLDVADFPALCPATSSGATAGMAPAPAGHAASISGLASAGDSGPMHSRSGSVSATPARSTAASRRSSFGGSSNAPAAAAAAAAAMSAMPAGAHPQGQGWSPYGAQPPPPPPGHTPAHSQQQLPMPGLSSGSSLLQVQAPAPATAGLYSVQGGVLPGMAHGGPRTPSANHNSNHRGVVPGASPRSPPQPQGLGGEELPWDMDHFESMVMSVVTDEATPQPQATPMHSSSMHHSRTASLQLGGYGTAVDMGLGTSPGLPASLPGVQGALDLLSPVGTTTGAAESAGGAASGSSGASGLSWGNRRSRVPTPQQSQPMAPAGAEDATGLGGNGLAPELLMGLSSQPGHLLDGLGSTGASAGLAVHGHTRGSQTSLGLFAGDVWVGAPGGDAAQQAAGEAPAPAATQQTEAGAWAAGPAAAAAAWSSWGSAAVGASCAIGNPEAGSSGMHHNLGAGPDNMGQPPGSPSLTALAMLRSGSGAVAASSGGHTHSSASAQDGMGGWHPSTSTAGNGGIPGGGQGLTAAGSVASLSAAVPGTPAGVSRSTAPSTPAMPPAAPRELDPLPHLPASLFDGDDGELDLGFSSGTTAGGAGGSSMSATATPLSSGTTSGSTAGTGSSSHMGTGKPQAARTLMGNHVHAHARASNDVSSSGGDTSAAARMAGGQGGRGFGQPPPPPHQHGMHPGTTYYNPPGMEWYPQAGGWQPPPPPPPGLAAAGFAPGQSTPMGLPPHAHAAAPGLFRPGLSHMAPAWDAGGFWQQPMRAGQHVDGGGLQQQTQHTQHAQHAQQHSQHGHGRGHGHQHGRGHHGSAGGGHAVRYRAH